MNRLDENPGVATRFSSWERHIVVIVFHYGKKKILNSPTNFFLNKIKSSYYNQFTI